MPTTTISPDYLRDGNFTDLFSDGPPRYEYPFRGNGDVVSQLFEQDYWQSRESYVAAALGTPFGPGLMDFYFIAETKPVPVPALLLRFTRTAARIPTTQTDYTTVSLTKPSLAGLGTAWNFQQVTGSGTSTNLGANYLYLNYGWDIVNNRVYGPFAVTTSANSGGNTTLNWTGHGLLGTERIMVYAPTGTDSYWIFSSGQYTIVNANTLTLTGFNFGTTATLAGKYLRAYTAGLDRVGAKLVTQFYLPGVTAGITTPQDIPIPSPLLNSAQFLAAVVANVTGYVTYDAKELSQWRESPIYQLGTVQINMADVD